MAQEIVQKVGYKLTGKARTYISEELGYDFSMSDPLDIIHTIAWLKANGHPLELKLELESLKKEGPINYIVDMQNPTNKIEIDMHYLFPHRKMDFGGRTRVPMSKAAKKAEDLTELNDIWESAEIEVGFDEPGLNPTKTVSFVSKLPVKGLEANNYTAATGGLNLEKPKGRF